MVSGFPDLHGLLVPVLQPAGQHEQLRRAVWLRLQLDRGAMQAWRPAGLDVRHSQTDRSQGQHHQPHRPSISEELTGPVYPQEGPALYLEYRELLVIV